jgi:membrane protease YdiL (CAAX protease family)
MIDDLRWDHRVLWPLMRRRLTFVVSSVIMVAVWWIYHAVLTFAGWYGFNGGIPAFSVALGFVLFVGVLTERSRSVWPSVLAHGSWNALVQSYFSSSGAEADRVFTGSRYLLGEFGWLGAACMLILGIAFAWWHLRTPTKDGLFPKGSDRLPLTVDVAVVPQRLKAQTPAVAT